MSDEVAAALEAFLAERLPQGAAPTVTGVRRLSGGSSQENWAFDASWLEGGGRTERALLLRREPPAGVVATDRRREFDVLRALAATALPVPAAYWYDAGNAFGAPAFVIERRVGRAERGALRAGDPLRLGDAGRATVAAELAGLLAEVHGIDVAAAGLASALPMPDGDPAAVELAHWVGELDRVELEPQPALRYTVEWLRERLPPPPERITLVHGDFRPANVLVDGGRVAALLDWELTHLGDPADDIGWYFASVYRAEHFIPGLWECADFLARYAASAPAPEPDRLQFWAVLSMFRLAVIALTAAANFAEGRASRPAVSPDRLVAATLRDTGLLA